LAHPRNPAEQDAKPDGDTKREITELRAEVCGEALEIGFRRRLSHDKLPCRFGVGRGLLLGNAVLS